MAGAFAPSCFQDNAFQIHRAIASTVNLQMPVNCVLAGSIPIVDRYREWDVPAARRTERQSVMRSRVGKLGGERLSRGALRNTFNE